MTDRVEAHIQANLDGVARVNEKYGLDLTLEHAASASTATVHLVVTATLVVHWRNAITGAMFSGVMEEYQLRR